MRALILGVGGQDGSFLADLLLSKGYDVHGVVRHSSHGPDNLWRIQHLLNQQGNHLSECNTKHRGCSPACPKDISERLTLHSGDLLDPFSIRKVIEETNPAEMFNLADQDHVGFSLATPAYSMAVTAGGAMTVLEAVRQVSKNIRVFQPCSATQFGCAPAPQHERTPFAPQSPYAVAKCAAFYAAQHYRREHGMHVSTAILYNHDSVRRRGDYLLHKICQGVARIAQGVQDELVLGDLSMLVDIGHAPEYVEGMWKILQQDKPDDFILASDDAWSIRDITRHAFEAAGVPSQFEGRVRSDSAFARPGPQPQLIGHTAKARRTFGWNPQQNVMDVVELLVRHYESSMETIA